MDLTTFSPSSALLSVIVLALAPFAAVMLTSFTKIVVVLSLLRNALGVQQVPPNLVINGLAMVLTLYVMYPVGQKVLGGYADSGVTLESTEEALTLANVVKEPLREFLLKHTDKLEQEFFATTVRRMNMEAVDEVISSDFIVLIPAFTISELTEAFQIGFLIFLPFIIIDLVVSNILMAMGMMMLSPTIVSLPFKLLLFVVIDGWAKLAHGLVLSYL